MADTDGLDLVVSFLTVVDEMNFRRASERLHLDQSALSRRIQKLEHILGFRLLERTTREVALTQAGDSFFRDNVNLLAQYEASVTAARQIAEGKTGVVRVAYMAFATFGLMPAAVARFSQTHPHIQVRLQYIRTQGQKLALARDEVDLGYMIGPFDHPDYHSLLLATEPLCVMAPRDHPLLRRPVIRPADLAGEKVVLGDRHEWGEYRRRLDDMFSAEGVELDVTLEASNTLGLVGLVSTGLGVTVCPEGMTGFFGHLAEGRPIMHPAFRLQTVLAWKRSNHSPQVRAFIDIARDVEPSS